MAIIYKDRNGNPTRVKSVVFKGIPLKKLEYGINDTQKRIVWCESYTLSVQQGVGVSSLTVNRTASQEPSASIGVLANGDTIYYGDTLTVSATAQTGFVLNSYTKSYTVTDNLTIGVSATANKYTLSISKGTGVTSVTVTRTSSPNGNGTIGALSSGATIYYGDKLSVTASPSTGYTLNGYTNTYNVQGNVSVSVTAYVQSFVLSLSKGTGVSSVTVKRTSSPKQGAAIGNLANGSTIYYGDTLTVSAVSLYGYTMNSYTSSYTVTGNISLNITARVNSYTLTISKGTGVSSVTVTRTSSPRQGAATGQLSNNATIYYGDTLSVSASPSSGYVLDSYTTSYTVTGNVTASVTATSRPYLNAPGISGSMTHDIYSNAMYLTLYLSNPNSVTVTADIVVKDYNSGSVLSSGTISMSSNQSNRQYNVGELWTTKVNVTVTLSHSSYAAKSSTVTVQGSFGSSSGGSSGSGSTSSGQS